ncbi:MAG: hypothetical protein ABII82_04425 [Verrucomicrobiota bacterium]
MKFDLAVFRTWRTAAVVLTGLLVAGLALRPVESPAWEALRAEQPALKLDSIQGALGQGVTVGLLGGFRAIVADFFWLKTNSVWGDNDLPATQTYVHLVTAIDPRPLYFWLNGSRMIAYDMPNWRIQAAGGYDIVPQGVQRKFDEEQSAVAVDYLQSGLGYHPNEPLLLIEIANVYLNRLKDNATAAEYYLQAASQPDAPHYAARIYAELLRRLGRNREAYDWLKKTYVDLPKGPDASYTAQPDVVLERIRELEEELGVPAEQAFQP